MALHTVVDLRSDTVTKPTKSMKEAMVNCPLGDDVLGEDPTVNALEREIAELLEMEAALFVTSGTMANLLALMVHCEKRGSEALVGHKSHIFRYEQGGASHLGGIMVSTIQNKPDGTFDLDEMERRIRGSDIHEPITTVVAIENTHNACGGKALPEAWVAEAAARAGRRGAALHVDGARLWEAAARTRTAPARLVRGARSAAVCFSKGLGAPAGSALVGPAPFIQKARRLRKMLGGGTRQAGVLAAAAAVALRGRARLGDDHRRARALATAIRALNLKYFFVDLENLHTNIVMLTIEPSCAIDSEAVIQRLAVVTQPEINADCKTADDQGIIIKAYTFDNKTVRFVLHYDITDEDMWLAVMKLTYVLREIEGNCK